MSQQADFLARLRRNAVVAGLIGVAGQATRLARGSGGERPVERARPHRRQPGLPASNADWRAVRGHAPGLEGLSGRIALKVADAPVGALQINDDGAVSVIADSVGAEAAIAVDSEDTLAGLLAGERAPIAMELQGRARIAGDARFALSALYGLQEGSPWATRAGRS